MSDYMAFSYYEKWIAAIRLLVVEKGLVSNEEIEARLAELRRGRAA